MNAELVPTVEPRRSGIGGGDIAAIVGVHPRRTAWDVFAYKRALIDGPDPEGIPEFMKWGNLLQRPILEEYGRRQNADDLELHFDTLFRHPEREWQIGHIDGERIPSDVLVEGKTVGLFQAHRYGEDGTDEIPEEDLTQGQWYLSLRDRAVAHFPVLVGGQELRIFVSNRNRTLEDYLLTQADKFWREHVLADVPPPVGDSKAASEYLKKAFPKEAGTDLRPPTEKELAIVTTYADARAKAKHWESLKSGLENQLKFHIGNSVGLTGGDDWKISWKKTADSQVTAWEAAAREALLTLQMIVSAQGDEARATGIELAKSLCTDLLPKHTRKKLGSRRFLPTGRLFKESGEIDG
jgi:putative phage-type endonuclease